MMLGWDLFRGKHFRLKISTIKNVTMQVRNSRNDCHEERWSRRWSQKLLGCTRQELLCFLFQFTLWWFKSDGKFENISLIAIVDLNYYSLELPSKTPAAFVALKRMSI